MGKLMKNEMNAINATLAQTITDIQALRPTVEDLRYELTHLFGATDVASGSVASFSDGAGGVFVKNVKVNITPSQSGSGDPSPTNIRPISGYTQAVITNQGSGKTFEVFSDWGTNLLQLTDSVIDYQGIHYVLSTNGTITLSGVRTTSTNGYTSLQSLWTLAKGTYCFSGDLGKADCYLKIADSNGNQLVVGNGTFTINADTQVRLQVQFIGAVNLSSKITFKPQLEAGTTPSVFRPYANPYVGTVYGGSLNLTTGELVSTMGMVDLGTLSWSNYTSGTNPVFRVNLSNRKYGSDVTAICSNYPFWGNSSLATLTGSLPDKNLGFQITNRYMCIRDTSYTNATTFKSAMSGVQLVYELATPQTYQLTPKQLLQFTLDNNISANCGDVEVTYRLNLNTAIERLQGA